MARGARGRIARRGAVRAGRRRRRLCAMELGRARRGEARGDGGSSPDAASHPVSPPPPPPQLHFRRRRPLVQLRGRRPVRLSRRLPRRLRPRARVLLSRDRARRVGGQVGGQGPHRARGRPGPRVWAAPGGGGRARRGAPRRSVARGRPPGPGRRRQIGHGGQHRAGTRGEGQGAGGGGRRRGEPTVCPRLLSQVLARGERIETLVDKTDDLRTQADRFQRTGAALRRWAGGGRGAGRATLTPKPSNTPPTPARPPRKMWWNNVKLWALLALLLAALALVIFLSVCFRGGNCFKGGGGGGSPPPPPPAAPGGLPP